MNDSKSQWLRELSSLLRLAIPVAGAELAWMMMGVVDTWMLGKQGPEAIGGLSIGRIIYMNFSVAGAGLLAGLDATISQAYGAKNLEECWSQKIQGTWLAIALALLCSIGYFLFLPWMNRFGIQPLVLNETKDYMFAIGWGMLPLLLYQVYRRFLQGVGRVVPIFFALVSANVVNYLFNHALIFGNWGFPELGTAGAGWATAGSTLFMTLMLAIATYQVRFTSRWRAIKVPLHVSWRRVLLLLKLGVPASIQITIEVMLFSVSALWIGRLAAAEIAAHQIALVLASLTYMVPLGISSAAAVRVGQNLGAKKIDQAKQSGWLAMGVSTAFMTCAAITFVLAPGPLVTLFSDSDAVLEIGVPILWMCAAFQLFDGVGVTCTGALRGAGETLWPMIWSLIGYWLIAMPLGYYWIFHKGWGAVGLWGALSLGLMLVAMLITGVWLKKSRKFSRLSNLSNT